MEPDDLLDGDKLDPIITGKDCGFRAEEKQLHQRKSTGRPSEFVGLRVLKELFLPRFESISLQTSISTEMVLTPPSCISVEDRLGSIDMSGGDEEPI
uniref:AlNc14C63G4533 protein n=1 Tax=Albugo laibachii Nc14 TaxID=890382 RepID=F0WD09_9STRA|nr:AlNc14C63G4533 [Albugo laibachii Nc14]|eukprot:CCA19081.1 AlNc14C63G4533 [Albugo laibachii Nc14]